MGRFKNKYTTETANEYVRKFGCELLSEYAGMNNIHKFRCKCGNEFSTTFAKFQNRGKRQCNKCGRKKSQKGRKLSLVDVKKKISEFNCTCLSEEYINYSSKLTILCHCGNIFMQSYANFIAGKHQCPKCSRTDANESKNKYTYEDAMALYNSAGSKILTPKTKKYIGYKDHITVQCSCGNVFETLFGMAISYNKLRCYSCNSKDVPKSSGEDEIKKYLLQNNYDFMQEYSFPDCKHKYVLRFDFMVIINEKMKLIEYDGIQHFKPYDYYGGQEKYDSLKKRDFIKDEYCKLHSIPLLRIAYTEKKNIPYILKNYLTT